MSAIKRWIENEAERLGITFDEFMNPTPDDSEISVPSCFTCKHVKTWHQSQTRDEPEDSGWECNHPNQALINEVWVEPEDDLDDEQLALCCADRCPGYEFFDWDLHRAAQDDALATEALRAQASYAKIYKMFGVIE